jgi:hypothetical protein
MAHALSDDAALAAAQTAARATSAAPQIHVRALRSWHVVAALSIVCTDFRDATVDAIFAAFDVDHSGWLDLAEVECYLATALAFSQHLRELPTYDALAPGARRTRAACNAHAKRIARAMVARTFTAAGVTIDRTGAGGVSKADFLHWLTTIVGHPPGHVDWDAAREAAWQLGEVDHTADVMAAYG